MLLIKNHSSKVFWRVNIFAVLIATVAASCSSKTKMDTRKTNKAAVESVSSATPVAESVSLNVSAPEVAVTGSEILVTWLRVAAAESYNVVISQDESCTDPDFSIKSIRDTSQKITISKAKTYFVCIAAIDQDGKSISTVKNVTKIVVSDDGKDSANSDPNPTAAPNPPAANAGADQNVSELETVTLDGRASTFSQGSGLTYLWSQIAGTAVTLSSSSVAQPTFIAPNALTNYTLTFRLIVNDGTQNSIADTVDINVTASNDLPLVNAGPDQNIAENALVTLNGSSSSDPEGQTLTYQWTQTAGTTVTLSNAAVANPTFTAPNLTTNSSLTFRLIVNDGVQNSLADLVTINITASNDAPVANAGVDQNKSEQTNVTLDGSGSSDPEGQAITYAWTQTAGTSVSLSSSTASQPTFTIPNVTSNETMTFRLIVNDGAQNSAAATVSINVTATNDNPTAAADTAICAQDNNVSISAKSNDTDAETAADIAITSAGNGGHGTTVLNGDQTITYTPNASWNGVDTFTYTLSDGHGGSATGTVTVYVYPTPTAFTWTGAVNSNWNNNGNWYGGTAPGASDIALFSAKCGTNCPVAVNASISVKGISMDATFLGTIAQGAGNTITVGVSGWTQNGGIFAGGNSGITVQSGGTLAINGGTFTSTSGTLNFIPPGNTSITLLTLGSGGNFVHNSGTMSVSGGNGCAAYSDSVSLGKALALHNFTLNRTFGCGGGEIFTIPAGQTFNVNGTFTHTVGYISGTINLYGNLVVGSGTSSGGGTIAFVGNSAQTYTSTSGGYTGGITVNTTGSVTPAAGTTSIYINGDFNLAAGSFTAPSGTMTIGISNGSSHDFFTMASGTTFTHNSGTLLLSGGASCAAYIYSTSLAETLNLYNLTTTLGYGCGPVGTINIPNGQTLNVNGTLTENSGYISGTVNLYGNLVVGSDNNGGGPGPIQFVGNSAHTYASSGGRSAGISINSAGAVTPAGGTTDLYINGGAFTLTSGNFTAPSGTLTMNVAAGQGNSTLLTIAAGTTFAHNSGTLGLVGVSGCAHGFYATSLGQALDIYNLTVNFGVGCGGVSTLVVTNDNPFNVRGTFTQAGGGLIGNVNVYGDVMQSGGSGTGTLTFIGTGAQSWTRSSETNGATGNVTINKASGTATLASNVNLSTTNQSLTITSGTLNLSGNTLTVNKTLAIGASGVLTVNGGSFTPNSGGDFINNGTLN